MARLFLLVASMLLAGNAEPAVRFAIIGDYGSASVAEGQVAALIQSWSPDFVITTGDNSYGANDIDINIGQFYAPFIGAYAGSFGSGSPVNRFFPSMGNHDYSDGGGSTAYHAYFTLPGTGIQTTSTSGNQRYYDFVIGPVHFFVLNSNFLEPDGILFNSTQAAWLQAQLAASEIPWKVVYFHHPPFSSGQHGSNSFMQWPFEDWGASLVLSGHDHTYERIHRDDNANTDSLTYIVTGLGGKSIYSFTPANLVPGSVIRYNGAYGANWAEATDSTLSLKFVNTAGITADSIMLVRTAPCCIGTTGNINGMGTVDLSDLSALISHLTGRNYRFPCQAEANIDKTGTVDLTDLSMLIGYLTGFPTDLPACP